MQKNICTFWMILGQLVLFAVQSGCGLDASLKNISNFSEEFKPEQEQRVSPDFVASEVVTTGNKVELLGSFGEVSERVELANQVVVEGAFYE